MTFDYLNTELVRNSDPHCIYVTRNNTAIFCNWKLPLLNTHGQSQIFFLTWVLGVDSVVCNVQCFASPEVMMGHGRSLLSVHRSGKTDVAAFHKSVEKKQEWLRPLSETTEMDLEGIEIPETFEKPTFFLIQIWMVKYWNVWSTRLYTCYRWTRVNCCSTRDPT